MKEKLNGLDLFSGIGGISEALSPWVGTVAYCENERYAQAVLLSRMSRGEIDNAPIWDDVTTLKGKDLPEIDIISGGFPCQDISIAGSGAGLAGKRSGLFGEIVRLSSELRPEFIFLENVPAITFRGLAEVTGVLAELRYDCRWGLLSAFDMGAPHRRERWWLLAHSKSNGNRRKHGQLREKNGQQDGQVCGEFKCASQNTKDMADTNNSRHLHRQTEVEPAERRVNAQCKSKSSGADVANTKKPRAGKDNGRIRKGAGGIGGRENTDVADTNETGLQTPRTEQQSTRATRSDTQTDISNPGGKGLQRRQKSRNSRSGREEREQQLAGQGERDGGDYWPTEPNVGRVVNGLPFRNDRLKCLGNSVVPQCAREAFKRLGGLT